MGNLERELTSEVVRLSAGFEQLRTANYTLDVAAVQANIAPALRVLADVEGLMPKAHISNLVRAQEALLASALPQLDWFKDFSANLATQILPALTLPHINWMADFNKTFASQLAPLVAVPRFEFPTGLLDALRIIDWDLLSRRSLSPSNWPDEYEEHLPGLLNLVNIEGIPTAWVPRESLLLHLLAAGSPEERSALMISHREEILEDCEDWVNALDDEFIAPQLPIAKKVLAACRDGHWEVAAISAVTVVHAVVESLHWVSDKQRASKHHRLTMQLPASRLLEQATRAPLAVFYDDWDPKSGKPRPAHLMRHVVSHHLAEDQVSARNCIVAVMLMASLLVSVEQLGLGRQETAA